MSLYTFGSGTMFGRPTGVSYPTPTRFGVLQEAQVDISATTKSLVGGQQYPVAVARSEAKIECKAKYGRFSGRAFSDLFFGETLVTSGLPVIANGEAAIVPSSTPFTVVVANAASFLSDWGVINAATGIPLTRVESSPATGQYSVVEATGTYTFAEADAGKALLISYQYTATTGQGFTINNQLQGVSPTFEVLLEQKYGAGKMNLHLYSCCSSKLSFPFKQGDFNIPEFDFSAMANAADIVGVMWFSEVS